MPFRQRLVIECFGCRTMPGVAGAYGFLLKLSETADMRVLVPPIIVEVPVLMAADAIATTDVGVSGQIIWLESGAQIHTWPEERFLTLDMFSCKRYSKDAILELLREVFAPRRMNIILDDMRTSDG